jgi:hypothetical protein
MRRYAAAGFDLRRGRQTRRSIQRLPKITLQQRLAGGIAGGVTEIAA